MQGKGYKVFLGRIQMGKYGGSGGRITPHLHRSKDIEASGFNGTAAFMEVRVQSIVVEFILTHVEQLFGGAALSGQYPSHPPHHHSLGSHIRVIGGLKDHLVQSSHFVNEKTESHREMLLLVVWRRPWRDNVAVRT